MGFLVTCCCATSHVFHRFSMARHSCNGWLTQLLQLDDGAPKAANQDLRYKAEWKISRQGKAEGYQRASARLTWPDANQWSSGIARAFGTSSLNMWCDHLVQVTCHHHHQAKWHHPGSKDRRRPRDVRDREWTCDVWGTRRRNKQASRKAAWSAWHKSLHPRCIKTVCFRHADHIRTASVPGIDWRGSSSLPLEIQNMPTGRKQIDTAVGRKWSNGSKLTTNERKRLETRLRVVLPDFLKSSSIASKLSTQRETREALQE